MTASFARDAVDPATLIIQELESADWRQDALLRRAVQFAKEISPQVVGIVRKAANRTYLLPREKNLLFWGIHVLAAARRTELFRPLLDLVRRNREEYFDRLLGDAATETLPGILISTFDGEATALIDALGDRNVDSFVRWSLFDALARLTFDGRVQRQTTHAFLDRFERERLADAGDEAWEGWVDAITHLGIYQLYDSIRRAWDDALIPPDRADREIIEERFAEARALQPGDPAMFVRYGRQAIDDPARALEWTATEQDHERSRPIQRRDRADPAGSIALKDEEIDWLEGFLRSEKVGENAMSLEQVDGFFHALACGPSVPADEYMAVIWDTGDDPDPDGGPAYDSEEQADLVTSLLQRHLKTIALRLERGHRRGVIVETDTDELMARYWAGGFIRGVALRAREWGSHENAFILEFLNSVVALGTDEEHLSENGIDLELRDKLIDALPTNLLRLYRLWRGHDDPYPPPADNRYEGRKVGRNEPCPCGSGKKFKFCCGSPTQAQRH